ncbi:hypothetical protein TSOC_010090, partial [Tetrabaena socialis]
MEDNLKRIVSEATRLCRERGQKVDPHVMAYVATLEDARGALDGQLDGKLPPAAVATFGEHVAGLVMRRNDQRLKTAMMQVLMEVAFKQQRELIEKETGEQQERAGMLQRAVTGPRALKGNTPDAYDKFYRLVVEAVCVEAGMELAVHDATANAEVLNRGQALQLYESLQADLQEGLDAAQQLDSELEHTILQVHDAVGSSAAVSKDVVYPMFDRLGALHAGLHQELRMLVVRQRLYEELTELATITPDSALAAPQPVKRAAGASTASATGSRAGSAGVAAAAAAAEALSEQLSEATLSRLDALGAGAAAGGEGGGGGSGGAAGLEYVRPASHSQLQAGLALAGFCAGTLARRPTGPHPLLRRANPRLGYLAFQDKVYGFATNADMQAFLADPEGCLAAVAAAVALTNADMQAFLADPEGCLAAVAAAVAAEPLLARPLGLPPPRPTAAVHSVLQERHDALFTVHKELTKQRDELVK